MTAIANLPDIRPSLLLDFANSGRVDPRIQCTRASAATCFGSDGKLRTVAANVPRIDYDPATGKCLGLLVEESRTNFAYPSNMPTSTVQTTTGVMQANGGAKITSGVLAPDGSSSGFSVSGADVGTNSSGANNVRALFALSAIGTYTISFWVKTAAGASSTTVLVRVPSATGTLTITTTEGWKRVSLVATTTTGPDSVIFYSAGGAAFDMWGIQIELGSFPTSYIPTEASAVTRAADIISLDIATLNGAINIGEGTFLAKYLLGAKSSSVGVIYAYDEADRSNNMSIRYASGQQAQYVINSDEGGQYVNLAPSGFSNPGYYKRAASFQPYSFNQAINGQLPSSKNTNGIPNSKLTRVSLGSERTNNQMCGHMQEFAVYGRALTDTQLQRLTA